jgi:hypothetical protein
MADIAVVNESTVVRAPIDGVVAALQTQAIRDFAPVWPMALGTRLRACARSEIGPGDWVLAILDDSDQAGALGYHDMGPNGQPLGKVFARTDLAYGQDWTATASHELLEMLANPTIDVTVFDSEHHGLYAREVCDACENEAFGYRIDGVLVSDFVFPAWFDAAREPGSTRFDFRGLIKKPFELLPGGYISYYDLATGRWSQITAERQNFRARPPVGSRRERLTIPPAERIRSAP